MKDGYVNPQGFYIDLKLHRRMKRAIEEDVKREFDMMMSSSEDDLDADQVLEKFIKRAIMRLRKEGDPNTCKIFSLFDNDAVVLDYLTERAFNDYFKKEQK